MLDSNVDNEYLTNLKIDLPSKKLKRIIAAMLNLALRIQINCSKGNSETWNYLYFIYTVICIRFIWKWIGQLTVAYLSIRFALM